MSDTMTLGGLRRRLADFDPQGYIEGVSASLVDHGGEGIALAVVRGERVKVITLRKYLGALVGRTMSEQHSIHDGVRVHLGGEGARIVGVSSSCRLEVEEWT